MSVDSLPCGKRVRDFGLYVLMVSKLRYRIFPHNIPCLPYSLDKMEDD